MRLAESSLGLGEVRDCVLGRFVPMLSSVVQFERLLGRGDVVLQLEAVKCRCS